MFSVPPLLCVIQWVDRCMLNMSTKDKAQGKSLVTMRQTELRGIPFLNVCAIRGNTPGRVHKVLLLSPERGCLFRTHPLVWVSRMWNVVANNSFPYSVYVWYQFLGREPNVCLLWFCKKANVRFWHVSKALKDGPGFVNPLRITDSGWSEDTVSTY